MVFVSCKRVEMFFLEVFICDEDGDYNILFYKMYGDLYEFDLVCDFSVKNEECFY